MGIANSVLQAVERNGDKKRFWTIDENELSGFKIAVDDSRKGIAGETIGGWIYHLTASSPSYMEKVGFKNMGKASLKSPPWK